MAERRVMFDKEQYQILYPIFHTEGEEFARDLAEKLESHLGYSTTLEYVKDQQPPWTIKCEAHIKRDLDCQRKLEKRLKELAEEMGCVFAGWRHTIRSTEFH